MTPRRVVYDPAERGRAYRRVLEARDLRCAANRLRTLARDEVRPVRLWTARNPSTPPDALEALARDDDESVRWNVLLNPRTPDTALRWMADREAREYGNRVTSLRQRILHHPGASPALRAELEAAGLCECPRPCGRVDFSQFGSSPHLTPRPGDPRTDGRG